MFGTALVLFGLSIVLSAFFNAAETAFIGSNPFSLEYLETKGSARAAAGRRILSRLGDFLAMTVIGNTLVNVAAASISTYVLVSLLPDKREAVLLSTAATTVLLLFFAEFNPKILAARNPIKTSLALVPFVRVFLVLFYPFVKAFTFVSSLIFPSAPRDRAGLSAALTEGETKILLTTGIKGMSAFRKSMIAEILEIASRPLREIMVPRPEIKALEISATKDQVLEAVAAEGFSRYPVYRGRLDHIEGIVHTKDLLACLSGREPFDLARLARKPFFLPESASVEKALLQMRDNAVHMAFVVDEFGGVEGLVTLEDILEEIVGDIRDESDEPAEDPIAAAGPGAWLVKGAAGIKDVNKRLGLGLPESADFTTLAGFFLFEFGRIPREKDALEFRGHRFVVERMNKRHIHLLRVEPRRAGREKV